METRVRRVLLTAAALLTLPGCATVRHWRTHRAEVRAAREEARAEAAQAQSSPSGGSTEIPPPAVRPEVERRQARAAKIKSSNFEIGAHFGVISIEDFGSHPTYGVDLAYHVTEDFFLRAELGRATAGRTSFETLGGNIQLLTEGERKFTYYDLGVGYNFLPGEAFLSRRHALTSSFYVLAGVGGTQFGGDKKFTVNVGGGYQVLPLDWLAVRIGIEDHLFQTNLLGADKLTNNLEAILGTTVFF